MFLNNYSFLFPHLPNGSILGTHCCKFWTLGQSSRPASVAVCQAVLAAGARHGAWRTRSSGAAARYRASFSAAQSVNSHQEPLANISGRSPLGPSPWLYLGAATESFLGAGVNIPSGNGGRFSVTFQG